MSANTPEEHAICADCQRQYGDAYGFPDLIIPYWAWLKISPSGDDGGLLCPSCICKRLHEKGIRCEGAFMSGPIISVSDPVMNTLRRVENIELAIEGRDNRWRGIRPLIEETAVPAEGEHLTMEPTSTANRVERGIDSYLDQFQTSPYSYPENNRQTVQGESKLKGSWVEPKNCLEQTKADRGIAEIC